jgi:hypothetical protein
MNQKETIIQKLFNDETLLHEELVYVSSNLKDGEVSDIIPFDHEQKSTFEACGVTPKDADEINKSFSKLLGENKDTTISGIVEKVEIMSSGNPKFRRLLLIQAVQHSLEKQAMKGMGDPFIKMLMDTFLKHKKNDEEKEEE